MSEKIGGGGASRAGRKRENKQTLDEANDQILSRDFNYDGQPDIYTLTKPYVEAALGVENIFKVLRVDALWRLSYLDHENIVKFGLRATFQVNF